MKKSGKINYDWLDSILTPQQNKRQTEETSKQLPRKDVEKIDLAKLNNLNNSKNLNNLNNTNCSINSNESNQSQQQKTQKETSTTSSVNINYSFRPSFTNLRVVDDKVVFDEDDFSQPLFKSKSKSNLSNNILNNLNNFDNLNDVNNSNDFNELNEICNLNNYNNYNNFNNFNEINNLNDYNNYNNLNNTNNHINKMKDFNDSKETKEMKKPKETKDIKREKSLKQFDDILKKLPPHQLLTRTKSKKDLKSVPMIELSNELPKTKSMKMLFSSKSNLNNLNNINKMKENNENELNKENKSIESYVSGYTNNTSHTNLIPEKKQNQQSNTFISDTELYETSNQMNLNNFNSSNNLNDSQQFNHSQNQYNQTEMKENEDDENATTIIIAPDEMEKDPNSQRVFPDGKSFRWSDFGEKSIDFDKKVVTVTPLAKTNSMKRMKSKGNFNPLHLLNNENNSNELKGENNFNDEKENSDMFINKYQDQIEEKLFLQDEIKRINCESEDIDISISPVHFDLFQNINSLKDLEPVTK